MIDFTNSIEELNLYKGSEKKKTLEEFRQEENQRIISKTTRLSKEELQRRLEETQSLHL